MGLIQFQGQVRKADLSGFDPKWRGLGLRNLIIPRSALDLVDRTSASLVGDVGVLGNHFDFPAGTGYVGFASGGGVVSQDNHTVVFVSLLRSFYSAYPFVANYQTDTSRRAIWYSNDVSYTDLMWNSGFVTRNRFTFPASVPVLNVEHSFVLRGNGSSADSAASGWVNGRQMTLATPAATAGAVSGISVLGQQGVGSYANRLNGRIGLFALFEGSLPDFVCQDLSRNPWILFKKRRIWVPVSAGGGGTYNVTLAESTAAADALGAVGSVVAFVAEAAAASELASTVGTVAAAVSESAAAAETLAAVEAVAAALTEPATVADLVAATMVAQAAVAEALAAADVVSAGPQVSGAMAEAATAADALTVTASLVAQVAEAASAADAAATAQQLLALITEASTVADQVSGAAPAAYSVTLAEVAAALDVITAALTGTTVWPLLAARGVSAHGHGSARPEQLSTATRSNTQ